MVISKEKRKSKNKADNEKFESTNLDDEGSHQKLISSIKTLNKLKNKSKLRSESCLNPSEFNLTKNENLGADGNDDAFNKAEGDIAASVGIDDLFASFYEHTPNSKSPTKKSKDKKAKLITNNELSRKVKVLSKRLNTTSSVELDDGIVLVPPPTKPVLDKAKMTAGYETVVEDVINKWDDVVKANRIRECIKFPLNNPDVQLIKGVASKSETFYNDTHTENQFSKTEFELEVEACLKNSQHNIQPGQEYTKAEESFLKAMSLEEAQARKEELAKYRALVSYKQKKVRHQNKIKSKRYRRMLRREKVKKETDEMEHLKAHDKSAYAQRLQELEEQRIQERMSLRHKNTGKWARNMLTQAKKDPNAKAALQEQFKLSKELTKKLEKDGSESEPEMGAMEGEEPNDLVVEEIAGPDAVFSAETFTEKDDNPWTKPISSKSVKRKDVLERGEELDTAPRMAVAGNDKAVAPLIDESCDGVGEMDSSIIAEIETPTTSHSTAKTLKRRGQSILSGGLVDDGMPALTFMDLKPRPLGVPRKSNNLKMTIAEAFADDDVVRQFATHKDDTLKGEREKLMALAGAEQSLMPGWGDWAGQGVQVDSKRLRQKLRHKTKNLKNEIKSAQDKRRDRSLKFVVINEEKDKNISKLQVSQIPYPFTNVKHFESTIRNPIGSLWNPQSVVKELTKPKIMTKLGTIITPIESSHLLKMRRRR